MRKVLVVTVLVLTALVYQMLSSFGGGNNDIAITPELQATIAAAGAAEKKLSAHLQQYLAGKTVDVDAMLEQQEQTTTAIVFAARKLEEMEGPDDELWREFHANCLACFAHSIKLVDRHKEIITYISLHNPGKEADFELAVKPLLELLEAGNKLQANLLASKRKLMARRQQKQ
jgi:hypothetical protein